VATQISDNQSGNFAAKVAADYSVQDDGVTACTVVPVAVETCYGDWYLPSEVELQLLYNQKVVVGGFSNYFYWSSTEVSGDMAWMRDFSFGYPIPHLKNEALSVRAVRAF
jgi:hypothetical protein